MTENIEKSTDAPQDRFCDLVMKGGITSGIVYPKAITKLSRHYRFKNIGGTSAGAIAAAVTAAAEYQRRKTGSRDGFDKILESIPDELGGPLTDSGPSRLSNLFQPQPKTRRLFSILVNALNRQNTNQRVLAIIAGFLKAYWPATLTCVLITPIPAIKLFEPGSDLITQISLFFVISALFVVLLILLIGLWVFNDVTHNVVDNGYGLCTGLTEDPDDALTPWLHKIIQNAAGLKEGEPPLTFGMLWDVEGFPPDWLKPRNSVRSIDLQMFSTNLAHGRPYIFPLAETPDQTTRYRGRERLFFNPDELKAYLPDDVCEWMKTKGKPYQLEKGREGKDPDIQKATHKNLREIPEPKDFPVLLAARMSLSFPFLLSAVPLWAINHDVPHGQRDFCKCWFSDGGISSNFPIHLFDGWVPQWPTFGINLESKIKGRKNVYLPEKYSQGYGERWNLFGEDENNNATKLSGFFFAIISAMQSWNDNSLARMPGVRDRIVRVRLDDKKEGGLNLDMKKDVIRNIVTRGEEAADDLIARFASQPSDARQTDGWNEQRFVRMCTLLDTLEKRAPEILHAFSGQTAYATDFETLIDKAMQWRDDNNKEPPAGLEQPLTQQEADVLNVMIKDFKKLMVNLDKLNALDVFKAIPEPELRIRPPL